MEAQTKTREAGTISLDPRYTDTAFTRVPNWVMERLGTLSRDARYTFIVLLKYARQDGHCWPGMDRLTADLGASRQSVHHWIKELEMVGLVEVIRCGQGRSNDYRFHWPDWLDGGDVNAALPQNDVSPALRQSKNVNPALRQSDDDVKQANNDVKQALPYVDTCTKTQGTPVPGTPVDIATKGDTSARAGRMVVTSNMRARAREAPQEQSLPRGTLDPRPDWVPALTQQIQEHWGGNLLASEREEWREWVWQNLRGEDPPARTRFLAYAFGNNYIPKLSSPRGVLTFLGKDLESWRRSGRPPAKGGTGAPKVPAHVQWEHDHAHNPQRPSPTRCVHCKRCIEHGEDHTRDCPTEVRRLADQLRKVGRNKDADDYLRKHGLLRESHATG